MAWRHRRRAGRIAATIIVAVVVAIAVVLVATGHPPKHCTWRYTYFGKGAYSAECVVRHR